MNENLMAQHAFRLAVARRILRLALLEHKKGCATCQIRSMYRRWGIRAAKRAIHVVDCEKRYGTFENNKDRVEACKKEFKFQHILVLNNLLELERKHD